MRTSSWGLRSTVRRATEPISGVEGAGRMDRTRWWFEPSPVTGPPRSITVLAFEESHADDSQIGRHGTIEVEVEDDDERAWSRSLGGTWRIQGAGELVVARLNGPLAVSRDLTVDGLPERQTWRWEALER